MPRSRSLNSWHFVIPGAGRCVLPPAWLPLALAALSWAGCARHPSGQVEDTLTSGRIQVEASPEVMDLLAREIAAFQALYPEARIALREADSRAAVSDLYGGRTDLVAMARELDPEERSVAVKGRLELEGYRIARDAICLVVNAANPVENLSVDELRQVCTGEASRWKAFGGPDEAIVPVFQGPTSDLTRAFLQQVMGGQPITAPAVPARSDSEVVARVAAAPGGLGYVSLAWADRPGIKALHVAPLSGLGYEGPDPEAVYRGTYPLTRYLDLYVRTTGPRLANGFITYVTSRDGQSLVHATGRVPTAVPVRFVRRSPLLGTH